MTVHEDDRGAPRVVFVMNPTTSDLKARVSVRGARALVDVLTPPQRDGAATVRDAHARITRGIGGFELTVPARTVRMLAAEVDPAFFPPPKI
jgi:hypothetical protein